MATRSAVQLKVVISAVTSTPGVCLRRCSAQALSLPLLHDRATRFMPVGLPRPADRASGANAVLRFAQSPRPVVPSRVVRSTSASVRSPNRIMSPTSRAMRPGQAVNHDSTEMCSSRGGATPRGADTTPFSKKGHSLAPRSLASSRRHPPIRPSRAQPFKAGPQVFVGVAEIRENRNRIAIERTATRQPGVYCLATGRKQMGLPISLLSDPILDVQGATLGNVNFGVILNQGSTSRDIEFPIRVRFRPGGRHRRCTS